MNSPIKTLYELEALPIGTIIGFNWPPKCQGVGQTYQLLAIANIQKERVEVYWRLLLAGRVSLNGLDTFAQFPIWIDSRNNLIGEPHSPTINI